MSSGARRSTSFVILSVACLSLGLAGCSMDEVELNGGIFDAVGLSPSTQKKSSEPKLAERAPLVVPPSLDRLPAPVEETADNPQIADIKDPDAEKKKSQAQLENEQAEYCKVHYEQAIRHGDETSAANAVGPLGPCRPSVLTAIKKWNNSGEEE